MPFAAFAGFIRLDAIGEKDFNLSLNALVQRRIESLHGVLFLVSPPVVMTRLGGFVV